METVSYRLILFAIALLPLQWAYTAARSFGRRRYRRRGSRRWRQAANLKAKLALGDGETAALIQRSFELEVSDGLEAAFFHLRPRKQIAQLVDVQGLVHLDAALGSGNGAILYSGHVWGNYTLFAALGLRGYPVRLVRLIVGPTLGPLQRWFHSQFASSVEKFGCQMLSYQPAKRGSSSGVAQALARNEIVIILIDLSMSKRNVPVRFFGGDMLFPIGPVIHAQAMGAPLLDFYVHRPAGWYPQVAEIGQPFFGSGSSAEAVQHCVSRLEEHIRRHPAEWAGWHVFTESAPCAPQPDPSISAMERDVEH